MTYSVAVQTDFDPVPSATTFAGIEVAVDSAVPPGAAVTAVPVSLDGELPPSLGLDRTALEAVGFTGALGQTLLLPHPGGVPVAAVGIGATGSVGVAQLRDAAGAFGRVAKGHGHLAAALPPIPGIDDRDAAQTVVEAVLLARYAYDVLRTSGTATRLERLTLVVEPARVDAVAEGAERGRALATAAAIARDLANSPPAHLTAARMAEVAERLAGPAGLEVEVFDKAALIEMGCGGLLGVNAGSHDEPRMIKLVHRPDGDPGHRLSLVGKGIMYDSGGVSLKPADGTHAQMKNDMSGAAAILGAMVILRQLACPNTVTAYLMCTDNMLSGTAMKMGDVITMRGGRTVEVMNTDAEGRLVMGDALVLANEEGTDAIVDIATLTGACLRALGPEIAGVMGNDAGLVAQVERAADVVDEPVWELPLARRYRTYLDSSIADIKNLGGEHAGALTAALFLEEFVDGTPWAHIDIAGTAQRDTDDSWRSAGCTGFGARLLAELAVGFTAVGERG